MSHQSDLIGKDIHAYLAQHERNELLRFLTWGNVDDGKSTLIGRRLHDSKMIYEDQLAAVQRDSVKSGTTGTDVDLALLVDGLQAEREQGITIDVAYRYFSTAQRKFIIADTPGHEQYTRNMATGASTCDLAIILIDARYGVQTQTKRHSFIVSLLGIKHVVVAVNKMDLRDYREDVFNQIRDDYLQFITKLDLHDVRFIPMSALKGDNVVNQSTVMPWYTGPALLSYLDKVEITRDRNLTNLRFPVQWVNRPHLDFRGFSGTVASGIVKPGDPIMALPSGRTSKVKAIVSYEGDLAEAFPPQSVTVTLQDEIDVSRGDMLVHPYDLPHVDSRFTATLVWMSTEPLLPGKQYYVKHTTRTVSGAVVRIHHRIDVNTLEQVATEQLDLNAIALCDIALTAPIAFDSYALCKGTGAFILIDRLSNVTVGAGMIARTADDNLSLHHVTPSERAQRLGHNARILWLSGSHRSDDAFALERRLFDRGILCTVLDASSLPVDIVVLAQELCRAGIVCICINAAPPVTESANVHMIVPADDTGLDQILTAIGLH